jgi:isocitrate dehydrogenase
MYTLAIDLPNLPKDGTVIIDGLGEYKNGVVSEVSDEEANAYQAGKAILVSDYDNEGKLHTSLTPGPTLVEAFANHPHIKVAVKAATTTKAVFDSGKEVN